MNQKLVASVKELNHCPVQTAQTTSPDLAPIMALHRHDDGYISFAVSREAGEDFRPLVSIRADEMVQYFPEFRERFLKDSYVAINADYQLLRKRSAGAAYGTPMHRGDRLRYLCAAYADIDFYKIGTTFGQVLGQIVDMQAAGILPKASMIVKSGRGMWLIFLLHDPKDPTRAMGAYTEKLELYYRLQKAIVERLALLGCDPCGKDPTRYLRVPGSLHSGSESHVEWWIQGHGPQAHSYCLAELCAAFGVEPRSYHPKERAAISPAVSAVKRRGWAALNARRFRDFTLLRSMRGGFSKGCRSMAALVYAQLLRTNGVRREEAVRQVNLMGAECHPRMTPWACIDAMKSGYRRSVKILDQTIADWLKVTPDESACLEGLPVATQFKPANPGSPQPTPEENRACAIAARRLKIVQIISERNGSAPPVREMGRLLIEAGFRGNHQTVQKDYSARASNPPEHEQHGRPRNPASSAFRGTEAKPCLFSGAGRKEGVRNLVGLMLLQCMQHRVIQPGLPRRFSLPVNIGRPGAPRFRGPISERGDDFSLLFGMLASEHGLGSRDRGARECPRDRSCPGTLDCLLAFSRPTPRLSGFRGRGSRVTGEIRTARRSIVPDVD